VSGFASFSLAGPGRYVVAQRAVRKARIREGPANLIKRRLPAPARADGTSPPRSRATHIGERLVAAGQQVYRSRTRRARAGAPPASIDGFLPRADLGRVPRDMNRGLVVGIDCGPLLSRCLACQDEQSSNASETERQNTFTHSRPTQQTNPSAFYH